MGLWDCSFVVLSGTALRAVCVNYSICADGLSSGLQRKEDAWWHNLQEHLVSRDICRFAGGVYSVINQHILPRHTKKVLPSCGTRIPHAD